MDYKNKYLKYKEKYNLLKQQGGIHTDFSKIRAFTSKIKQLAEPLYVRFVYNETTQKTVILIGENHYVMHDLSQDGRISGKTISDTILSFSKENDIEILLESDKEVNTDMKMWYEFVNANNLQYEVSDHEMASDSPINFMCDSKSELIKGMDTRGQVFGGEGDMIFMSNFSRRIYDDLYGFEYRTPDQQESLFTSIMNRMELVIISKLVIYILKRKDSSNPIIEQLYCDLLKDIKKSYKDLINYLNMTMCNLIPAKREVNGGPPNHNFDFVEHLIYVLPAKIFDFNMIEHILTSAKDTFIIYTGEAHTANVEEILVSNGYTIQSIM